MTLAKAVASGELGGVEIVGVVGASPTPSERVMQTAAMVGAQACSIDAMLANRPDWILEAAGGAAVRTHLPRLVASEANLIVMSIGALLAPEHWTLVEAKRAKGGEVMLPSGGIGGLDVLTALNALGDLEQVQITTTKAPKGLLGAPYLDEHAIHLPSDRTMVVFDGPASEAVRGFPANVNVAAALSIAGLGPERTRVRVVSDPSAARTRHEIQAEGGSGRFTLTIESEPNPLNPSSSYLAALSAVAAVRAVADSARWAG